MATFKYNEGFSYAANAAADLTGKEWFLCAVQSDGRINLAGNGGIVSGVLYEVDVADKPVTYFAGFLGKAVVGTAVTAGTRVASDANGKLKPATTGNYVVGIAQESGAAGTVVEFQFASGYMP